MIICIPVEGQEGLNSKVFEHFGSAPFFMLYDTKKEVFDFIDNQDQHHSHGMCQPLSQIADKQVDIVICGGMGMRAVEKLNAAGIKAYQSDASECTVQEIIKKLQDGVLVEITAVNACSHHGGCH